MHLLAKMASIGLYDLRETSHVTCEIMAYQTALDQLYACILQLEQQTVPLKPSMEQLSAFCTQFGFLVPPEMTQEQLEQYVQTLRKGCRDSSLLEIQTYLRALDAQVILAEDRSRNCVWAGGSQLGGICPSEQQVYPALQRLLPVGVQAVMVLGDLAWGLFDAGDIAWKQWNDKDFTWSWFHQNGYQLLEREN